MPVIILKHLEKECGRPIYELFDYVCGTSTGALLAGMVFIRRMELSKAEELYRDLSGTVFKKPNLLGLGQFFLNQAFYDSAQLERLIRTDKVSELRMYETSADGVAPRVRDLLHTLKSFSWSLCVALFLLLLWLFRLLLFQVCLLSCILIFILLCLFYAVVGGVQCSHGDCR